MEKNWKEIYIEDENACIPELSEREQAIIDGSAGSPQKREVSKLIKKLEINHLNGKARLLMVRYHKFYKKGSDYNANGLDFFEIQGWYQETQMELWENNLMKHKLPLQSIRIKGREPEECRTTFSERLKAAMAASNISINELSQKTGISHVTITKYLNESTIPNQKYGSKLAQVTGVRECWLLDKAYIGFTVQDMLHIFSLLNTEDQNRTYKLAGALLGRIPKDKFNATFSERFKASMANSGVSVNILSKKSCISVNSIFKYLKGTQNPKLEYKRKLANAMNVEEVWLIEETARGSLNLELAVLFERLCKIDRLRVYGFASYQIKIQDKCYQ